MCESMHGGVRGRGSNPPTYSIIIRNCIPLLSIFKKKISIFVTPEGYVTTAGTVPLNSIGFWKHNYLLKDHLGNTRKVLKGNLFSSSNYTTLYDGSMIDYYPFGMEITRVYDPNSEDYSSSYLAGYTTPYLYNGKEMDRMHGMNTYDYGARWREGVVPAWTVVDPLCEKYYSISP
ncbi:MAG: hypothetical protein Q7U47_05165 [Paludibacter sp.]|nr:hypothetical protein [Paludibacter sp.]